MAVIASDAASRQAAAGGRVFWLYLDAALEQAKEAGRAAPAGCSEDESFHFVNTSQSSLCCHADPGMVND